MTARAGVCAALAALAAFAAPLLSAQPGAGTGLRYGSPDRQTLAYAASCVGGAPPRPTELYFRGGWFLTDDLREQMREHGGNLEGVALVWMHRARSGISYPAAVYQWNHDLEFHRDVVACLDAQGKATREESRYAPADAGPRQRWTYLHSLTANAHQGGALHGSGRFLDAQGRPMGRPHLSTEDEDFIAGERVFHDWKDFDFARLVDAQHK